MPHIEYMYPLYYCTHLPTPENAAEEAIPLAVKRFSVRPVGVSELLIFALFFRMSDQNEQLMADLDIGPMTNDKMTGG